MIVVSSLSASGPTSLKYAGLQPGGAMKVNSSVFVGCRKSLIRENSTRPVWFNELSTKVS